MKIAMEIAVGKAILKLFRAVVLLILFALCCQARFRFNEQENEIPNNIIFGDLTGLGTQGFVLQHEGKHLFAAASDYQAKGLGHLKTATTFSKIFTLRHKVRRTWTTFMKNGQDMVCAIGDKDVSCYQIYGFNFELVLKDEGEFFKDLKRGTKIFVGDFTCDGIDDVLLYDEKTDGISIFKLNDEFSDKRSFQKVKVEVEAEGKLNLKGKRIFVGNFFESGEVYGCDDIITLDDEKSITAFSNKYEKTEPKISLSMKYSSKKNIIPDGFEFTVGNIRGGREEDIILHKEKEFKFMKADELSEDKSFIQLTEKDGVQYGELTQDISSFPGHLVWAKVSNKKGNRDDAILFQKTNGNERRVTVISSDRKVIKSIGEDGKEIEKNMNSFVWGYTQKVLSILEDSDNDGLLTFHELGGKDSVPLQKYGASPFVEDIFVEVDYMKSPPGKAWSLKFKHSAVLMAISEMAKKGINLHIEVDDEIPYQFELGKPDFQWRRDFDPLKNVHFTPERKGLFRYCIFANRFKPSATNAGIARGLPESDFVVSLGDAWTGGTISQQATTFLHELGHTLGLGHGGLANHKNFKPNYLSIMNYLFSWSGYKKNGVASFFYSETYCNDLNEADLKEKEGVICKRTSEDEKKGTTYETFYKGNWIKVNAPSDNPKVPIDWNKDGKIEEEPVRVNLDGDGYYTMLNNKKYPNPSRGTDDYSWLYFEGGDIGAFKEAFLKSSGSRFMQVRSLPPKLSITSELEKKELAKETDDDLPHDAFEKLPKELKHPPKALLKIANNVKYRKLNPLTHYLQDSLLLDAPHFGTGVNTHRNNIQINALAYIVPSLDQANAETHTGTLIA